jgi:NitT/TauT family transport system substrate-binding protein
VAEFVQLAANGLVTNETMIAEHPEAVQAFVSAMIHGIEDVIADPEAAYEVCFEYVEGLEEQEGGVQMEVLLRSIDYWVADRVGYIQPQAWENMQQVLLEMGLLSQEIDLEAAYTNQFVD